MCSLEGNPGIPSMRYARATYTLRHQERGERRARSGASWSRPPLGTIRTPASVHDAYKYRGQGMTAHPYAPLNLPQPTHASQLKIVSFNIWDVPYWFVKNRKQRILQIADYLRSLDAEIVCLQESFDVHHRRLLYAHLGLERYYASGGFEATRKAP